MSDGSIDFSQFKKSELPDEVEKLLKFISDKEQMKKSLKKVGVDLSKMPLGKISEETIKQGYRYLREIEKILEIDNNPKKYKAVISDLTSKFYSHVPHNFGHTHMSNQLIDSLDKIEQKRELLDELVGINKVVSHSDWYGGR